jgi:broad specificity phosphatase PhoE
MLILVRHGQQDLPRGRDAAVSEWVDPPLSEIGQRQAQVVGESLATDHIDAVYCSHLTRAHETGMQIGKHHGMEPIVLQELREIEIFRDLPRDSNIRDMIKEPLRRGMQERFVRERSWDVYPYTETSAEFKHRVDRGDRRHPRRSVCRHRLPRRGHQLLHRPSPRPRGGHVLPARPRVGQPRAGR